MLTALASRWWVVLLRGVVAILFGLLAISMPGLTLWGVVIGWGAIALVEGLASIFMGFGGGQDGRHWWEMVLLGLLGVVAGLTAFFMPGLTLTILIMIIAWWAIFRGVFEIFAAIKLRKVIDDEWILIFSGLLAVVFGGLLLWHPAAGAAALMIVTGWFMLFIGILSVVLAFRLLGLKKRYERHTVAHA